MRKVKVMKYPNSGGELQRDYAAFLHEFSRDSDGNIVAIVENENGEILIPRISKVIFLDNPDGSIK